MSPRVLNVGVLTCNKFGFSLKSDFLKLMFIEKLNYGENLIYLKYVSIIYLYFTHV